MFFNKKKIDADLKLSLLSEIKSLEPWYQPIDFGFGIKTTAVSKNGTISIRDLDRGIRKWHKFIRPCLPFDLKGKVVLDCGCNAGLFLIQACKDGARAAYGIEVDPHYYEQAHFTVETHSKIESCEYPVKVFHSSFEEFDYDGIGPVDLVLFLNTIYHIGRATHAQESKETVLEIQAEMIHKISKITQYILFQGNPLADEGRGKGKESLHKIIEAAGLEIYQEYSFRHARGLITIAKRQ